jgi:hypothetical protein
MRAIAVVLLVSGLFASTAAISVRDQQRWTNKLDAPLTQAAKAAGDNPVRVLIQLQPGATERFVSHLQRHGLTATRVTTSALIAVQFPASMLRRIAADRDVVRLSSEALVHGVGSALTGNPLP